MLAEPFACHIELTVRHTANAGVLLRIGEYALGIDVFSYDPEGLYPDTPPDIRKELLEQIEKGEIQALLFTHEHGDHFCPEDVCEVLRRNPKLHIISTETVISRLRQLGAKLCHATEIPKDSREIHICEIPGFRLWLFNSVHMGEAYRDVQNLVCMAECGGKRLLIPGDAAPTRELFARIAGWSRHIDWFLTPFPLVGLPSVRRMIEEELDVSRILALHLPRPEADAQGWLASAKSVCERAKDGLPAPEFGELPGKEYVWEI